MVSIVNCKLLLVGIETDNIAKEGNWRKMILSYYHYRGTRSRVLGEGPFVKRISEISTTAEKKLLL